LTVLKLVTDGGTRPDRAAAHMCRKPARSGEFDDGRQHDRATRRDPDIGSCADTS
jgi:hypothetical protein